MTLNRRELLRGGFSAAALLVASPFVVLAEGGNKPDNKQLSSTRQFISFTREKGGEDVFGLRMNDGWTAGNGKDYLVMQRMILEKGDDNIHIFPALDAMHISGLDTRLDDGSLGVTVPPVKLDSAILLGKLPDEITASIEDLKKLGFDPGVPTSEFKDYGGYYVVRFPGVALQYWKDDKHVDLILVGEAAFRAGMVPDDKQTLVPQYDLEPELRQNERFTPSTRGADLGACQKTNWTMQGFATYYDALYDPVSRTIKGCLGCRGDLVMMNGEKFDPNKFTTAININIVRQILGKMVLFQNPETGVGVIVKVTDSGGFSHLADMSRATAEALGYDKSRGMFPVVITVLNC